MNGREIDMSTILQLCVGADYEGEVLFGQQPVENSFLFLQSSGAEYVM